MTYHALLLPDEARQRERFRFEPDRRRFLITRALLRTVLSRYADIEPGEWRFDRNEHGRPSIANLGHRPPHLHFNLSHTNGLIVLAIATTPDVGIDVENVHSREAPLEVAASYFATTELADMHALPAQERQRRFFELWTLKESYIKARGLGLSIPLDAFFFSLTQSKISFEADPSIEAHPSTWLFWQWHVGSQFLVALCARTMAPTVQVVHRHTVPLCYETSADCHILRKTSEA